ncbi:sodium-dependent bicarbonate transport family permease [Thiohalophilus sp.]|uniref:sodium-dependent bicarbonate transport family permease n=1 Tax=Thiohalophilus sp. TaxID=3028392 RepID=UPI0039768A60
MSALSNLLIPAVLFFALGFFARAIKSDLRVPPDLAKVLSIYLLMAIGLHGGYALGKADLATAFNSVLWAIILGFTLPLIGYGLLLMTRKVDSMNAAAIAAHYGSVSAGTFLTAIAYLDNLNISYESYPVIMLAVMESPAIIVGLLLASWSRQRIAATGNASEAAVIRQHGMGDGQLGSLLHEAFTNGSVILLIGSMVIGAISGPASMEKLFPFIDEIFMGVLCLFLFEMGMEAARRIREFRKVGTVLIIFGLVMPLIGGGIGLIVGAMILNMSVGGTLLVAVLGASASYIAVPPAMRLAVPEANPSFYLTLSLGITFPFNVIIGIPVYHALAEQLVT